MCYSKFWSFTILKKGNRNQNHEVAAAHALASARRARVPRRRMAPPRQLRVSTCVGGVPTHPEITVGHALGPGCFRCVPRHAPTASHHLCHAPRCPPRARHVTLAGQLVTQRPSLRGEASSQTLPPCTRTAELLPCPPWPPLLRRRGASHPEPPLALLSPLPPPQEPTAASPAAIPPPVPVSSPEQKLPRPQTRRAAEPPHRQHLRTVQAPKSDPR